MTHRFNRAAEIELLEAALYYDGQRPGLGEAFLAEVDAAVTTVLKTPSVWVELQPGLRKYRVRRFPYGLYYRIDGDEVEIVAVANLRRRPGYWRDRLG